MNKSEQSVIRQNFFSLAGSKQKVFITNCWSCGKITEHVVHNQTGHIYLECICGATTVPHYRVEPKYSWKPKEFPELFRLLNIEHQYACYNYKCIERISI